MYEAGNKADMNFSRRRRFNHPETQTHRLNPSPSAPVAFHGSPFIDLIIGSEIVPPQPLPHSRELAPLIDLTGSPDSPTETPHRDRTASGGFRIPRPPPRSASSIFSNYSDTGMDRFTDGFDRTSATLRAANRNISTVANQPSATRRDQPTSFLELLISGAFCPLPRQPDRKPRTPSPPPTRVGFTRDTCADPEKDSENVAICPACGNELAYNPNDTVLHSPGNTSKRKREERPFWALKKCGHVYCADCYNTRKRIKIKRNDSDSRASDEKFPDTLAANFSCAVEDCDTTGSKQDDWVGIYL
ncbi:hypothetical protein FOMG_17640 [Fusarium oxysporum f. sp. melonis 26406]|uniref:Cell cycle control protein n=1 Tax=Fusarium oxysporum f. sp. melonis 26406 TaxID=1089452 RepID=W9ZXB2_FUSOX|nr:hypothetical protein FOMG_17640 [Fusarium oxysporum f. sp. melonis 26406]